MKKALIISSIIFVVSLIAFGVSVAVTGVTEGRIAVALGNYEKEKDGYSKEYTFTEKFTDIDIDSFVGDVIVSVEDVEAAAVYYQCYSAFDFNAEIKNGKLLIKESGRFILNILNWDFDDNESTIEIVLPAKDYGNVKIESESGDLEITNLICDSFESITLSGDTEYSIFADEIIVRTTSGCVNIENCTDRKADFLRVSSVSGDHSVTGFKTKKYDLYTTSGTVDVYGLSGEGVLNLTSGEINVEFAEWDGDMKVDAVSGEIDVTLPEESGVIVELDAVSGGVDVELYTEEEDGVTDSRISANGTSGIIGGKNVNRVDVDLVSGEVSIHN